MAMHKKLSVGSVLFTYHEPRYEQHRHRQGSRKYTILFKALYIHNRRERSTGANVPKSLIPTLNKLGIRYQEAYYLGDTVNAVGCRSYVYYRCTSNSPYPTPEEIKAAHEAFVSSLEGHTAVNEGVSLMEIDFVEEFKEKKMSNKDAIFSLSKPLVDYLSNEAYVN